MCFIQQKAPNQDQSIIVNTPTLKLWSLNTFLHWIILEVHGEKANFSSRTGDAQDESGTISHTRLLCFPGLYCGSVKKTQEPTLMIPPAQDWRWLPE